MRTLLAFFLLLPALASSETIPACSWMLQQHVFQYPDGDLSAFAPGVSDVLSDMNRILARTQLPLPEKLIVELSAKKKIFQFERWEKALLVAIEYEGVLNSPKRLRSLYAHEYGHAVFDALLEQEIPEFKDRPVHFLLNELRDQYEECIGYLFQATWADDGSITALPNGLNDYSKPMPEKYRGDPRMRILLWETGSYIWRELLQTASPEKRGVILEKVLRAFAQEIKSRHLNPQIRFLHAPEINSRVLRLLAFQPLT